MTNLLDKLAELLHNYLHIAPGYSTKFFITILIIITWQSLRIIMRQIIRTHIKDNAKKYIASKTSTYLLRIIVFIIFFNIWIGLGGELIAYFGLLSAGVAVALQAPISNFAGWIFIMIGKPFKVGDRIQIDDHMGDIIDIGTSDTSILEIGNWVSANQSTGRVIHIPNGWFLTKPIANFTQNFNFIWNELDVTLTFESDWQRAKKILETILKENHFISEEEARRLIRNASEDFLIYFKNLTPIVWTSVADSGVVLSMRYLCKPKHRRSSTQKIWEAVLISFSRESEIDLAYPTQRLFFTQTKNANDPYSQISKGDNPFKAPNA